MLKIYFGTGTAWTKMIKVEGTSKDDLLRLIEEYVMDHEDEFIRYEFLELFKHYTEEEIAEQFLSINGGQYYIHQIEGIEVVEIKPVLI
jgi:ribosomal 30S subunit maturation factor RimM